MPDRKGLGEEDLKSLVSRGIASIETNRAPAAKKQATALEYFQGKMSDLPNEKGRSGAVSRDVADVVGWMLPGIIRVFSASEHMAIAEPVGAEDEEQAEQATDGINYVFWKDNDGYRVLYNATWDSLLSANGVVKTWWDETPETKVTVHSGLTDEVFVQLVDDEDVEVLEHTEGVEVLSDPMTGAEMPITVHSVKIKRTTRKGRTCVVAIPPEDYGIDGDAKTCEDARFQYHREDKTRSDLIAMGFDRKKVESIGKASGDEAEQLARDTTTESDVGDPSMDILDLYECYVRADVNGDGIAELCRVMYAGNSGGGDILDWEEWEDETPFDDIPCNPMPHRWAAQSIADETMDVQRIKTALIRQALDNTYASNNPQRFVTGTITNPEELFSPTFGGAIMGEPGSSVTNLEIPFVAGEAYRAMEYQDQVIERRTGVSRSSMALDPEALQNQTATAVQNGRDAAYSQIELVARNQAELGWKKVFRKILRLEIKHQDQARQIRMRGKAVQIDPRVWDADMDITINVGLGTGSRDRDLAMLQSVLQGQMMLTQNFAQSGFPDKAADMVPFIMTTLVKSAEAAGIKSPEQFYPEIGEEEIAAAKEKIKQMQSQPDPKLQLEQERAKSDMQIQQAKTQADAQNAAQKMQIDGAMQERKLQAEAIRGEQEIALKREQLVMEMGLKREQLAAEMMLKRELSIAELEMKRELGAAGVMAKAASSGVHVGGEPG